MLSLEERADLLVKVAEMHRNGAYAEIAGLLARWSDDDLCSEPDLVYSLALAFYRTDQFGESRRVNRLLGGSPRARKIERLYRKHLILEGVLSVESGNLYEAEAFFHEAMAYATRADDNWVGADVMMNVGILQWIGCRWDKAIASFERALNAYMALGRRYSVAACHQNLGMGYRELAMMAESDAHFDEAYRLYASAPADRSYELSSVETERALLFFRLGDYDRAEALVRRALARVSAAGSARRSGEALRVLGVVLGGRGLIDEARTCLEEALELARGTGTRLLEAEVCEELSTLESVAGFQDSAKRCAAEAVRIYGAMGADARMRAVSDRSGVGFLS